MKNKLEAASMMTVGSDPAAPFEASQDASAGVKPEIENVCAESECSSATPADDLYFDFALLSRAPSRWHKRA